MPRRYSKKAQTKIRKVMSEYKSGTLRSGSGQKVTNRRQAVAIAMSEAGVSRPRKRRKSRKKGGM